MVIVTTLVVSALFFSTSGILLAVWNNLWMDYFNNLEPLTYPAAMLMLLSYIVLGLPMPILHFITAKRH